MDREKVVKGLERCKLYNKLNCDKCPYDYNGRGNGKSECTAELATDVLELLEEQKAVKPKCKERIGGFVAGICPTCGTALNNILNAKACGKCGQAVKW